MNIEQVIDGLQKGLDAVEKLAPLASALGAGPVAVLAGGVAAVAGNALDRIEEGRLVASEREKAVIQAIATEVAVKNDALAKAIASS